MGTFVQKAMKVEDSLNREVTLISQMDGTVDLELNNNFVLKISSKDLRHYARMFEQFSQSDLW